MALPKKYSNDTEYFESCLKFFKKYEKFYNFPNTDVLVLKILDEIPLENAGGLALEDLKIEDIMPDFFEELKRLQYDFEDYSEDIVKKKYYPNMSEKKIHEVNYLAKEVDLVCKSLEHSQCDTVIDLGSGLGYVDEILFTEYDYKVLGIECSEDHIKRAEIRREKCFPESKNCVYFINHTLNETSHEFLRECINNFDGLKSFCITGLHACADLGANALKIFLKMAEVKCMVLMSCCYHKMVMKDDIFGNFPMSKSLLDAFVKYDGFKFMKVPFMRLAAHPSNRTESLQDGVFNLLSRAVLQLYAHGHNLTLKRGKRKAVKTKIAKDFDSYMEEAKKGYKIYGEKCDSNMDVSEKHAFDIEEIKAIWREKFDSLTLKKAAIFLTIQNELQPVIENLILYDRIVYLKENGVSNCYFKQIFDGKLSPRCLALIAKR